MRGEGEIFAFDGDGSRVGEEVDFVFFRVHQTVIMLREADWHEVFNSETLEKSVQLEIGGGIEFGHGAYGGVQC